MKTDCVLNQCLYGVYKDKRMRECELLIYRFQKSYEGKIMEIQRLFDKCPT